MSDWFKFKNDELDTGPLQYCISEQPLVAGVWLLILSEASKKRSDKIPWNDEDFKLLGYARKINISPGIFNQCLGLLEHAGYIIRKDGVIEIPSWKDIQSDYARGLNRGYYIKPSDTLASPSEVSTARGEERREENHKAGGVSLSVQMINNREALKRVEERMEQMRGQMPFRDKTDQRIKEFADLKASRKQLMSKLGYPA